MGAIRSGQPQLHGPMPRICSNLDSWIIQVNYQISDWRVKSGFFSANPGYHEIDDPSHGTRTQYPDDFDLVVLEVSDYVDNKSYGNQECRSFHGYYDHYCFLPLYVYCGEQLLVAYLRPSKIDAAKHSRAILKLLVRRFRQVWPDVKIIFRGDSSFCRWKLLRWCDRYNVYYTNRKN